MHTLTTMADELVKYARESLLAYVDELREAVGVPQEYSVLFAIGFLIVSYRMSKDENVAVYLLWRGFKILANFLVGGCVGGKIAWVAIAFVNLWAVEVTIRATGKFIDYLLHPQLQAGNRLA